VKSSSVSAEGASVIALNFISFLVSGEGMERFSALTGLFLSDLKNGAIDPKFQGFVLEYALQDESLILEFAANQNIAPETIQLARFALPGASYDL
jgi:Protein of unknown function (DUF3572)